MARLQIPDEKLAVLEPFVSSTKPMEALVEQCIDRIGAVGPTSRFIVLTESDITAIEKRLGAPALGTARDLYQWIDRLADVRLGSISFEFTPAQYKEIRDRAEREGCQPVDTVRKILYAMIPQFFSIAAVEPPVVVPPRELVTAGPRK